jgi:hypothetical protein
MSVTSVTGGGALNHMSLPANSVGEAVRFHLRPRSRHRLQFSVLSFYCRFHVAVVANEWGRDVIKPEMGAQN